MRTKGAAESGSKRGLPRIDNVRIAAPCRVPWDDMVGDEHVRFCKSCEEHVYDLSALTPTQAEALLRENEGDLCVDYFQRKDGTVLTSDCPVGLRRRRLRNALIAIASATSVGAAALGIHQAPRNRDRAQDVVPIHPVEVRAKEKSVIVIIDPKGSRVDVDGEFKMIAETGAIGFVGTIGRTHAITVSFRGRSITENILIAPEDGLQYKIVLPPAAIPSARP